MTENKIAVDVVLLPDEEMTGRAIEANAELVKQSGSQIVLNREDCLPHISLAMGCIDPKDIPVIEKALDGIAEEYGSRVKKLRVTGVYIGTNSIGERVSSFVVEKIKELQLLHEKIMESMQPYFSYDVTADMVSADEVADSTLLWIRNYTAKSSYANFLPHITIGYGEARPIESPIEFAALRLALCHLGNHCTCRKVLASIEFEKPEKQL